MKAGVLSRVSTPGQEDGTSLDTQELACLAEAEKLDYRVALEHRWWEVWTGADLERPVLSQVRAAARSGVLEALIVYSADRLSRDPLYLLMLMKEFNDCGVRLHFVQGITDDTPEGQLIAYIRGYTAQKERSQIAERSRRGKEAVARSGRMPNGTGAGLFGYDYDVIKKVRIINEGEATTVLLMFRWAAEGVAKYQIAKRLNDMGIPTKEGCKWHAITVERTLENPAYTGVQPYGRNRYLKVSGRSRTVTPRPPEEVIVLNGFTPPIIAQEVYDRVQERLAVRQAKKTKAARQYLLTGFTRCPCGRAVVGACLNGKYRYYHCRGSVPTASGPAPCRERYIRADALEDVVWRRVSHALKNPQVLVAELQDHFKTGGGDLGQSMRDLKEEILELKSQQRRLIELRQRDVIDVELLESQIGPLKSLCDEKEQALRVLEDQRKNQDDTAEVASRVFDLCQKFSESLDRMDFDGKRSTLGAFGVKVLATREDVSITLVVDPKFTTTAQTSALQHARSRRSRWV